MTRRRGRRIAIDREGVGTPGVNESWEVSRQTVSGGPRRAALTVTPGLMA